MHTFFINTSKNRFDRYDDIFEICRENRELISLDFPIDSWQNEKSGYNALASSIGELIDNYRDVRNNYNLILYMDLFGFSKCREILSGDAFEREQCLLALKSALRRYMRYTIWEKLDGDGRTPRELLVIFEENEYPGVDPDLEPIADESMFVKYMLFLLGLPSVEEITEMAQRHFGDGVSDEELDAAKAAFVADVKNGFKEKEFLPGLLAVFESKIDGFLDTIASARGVVYSVQWLFGELIRMNDEDGSLIHSVSFSTNSIAGAGNQSECTRRDLRVMIYILDCCKHGIFTSVGYNSEGKIVRPFTKPDWEVLESALCQKLEVVKEKLREIKLEERDYSELKLSPKLFKLFNERFGIDKFGGPMTEIELEPKSPSDRTDVETEEDEDSPEVVKNWNRNGKVIRYSKKRIMSLFTDEQFPSFKVSHDFDDSDFDKWTKKPEILIEKAKELCQYHRNYLNELRVHVSRVLSNYAGRSHENRPALLKKRVVRVNDISGETVYNYRESDSDGFADTRFQKEAETFAAASYDTVRKEFVRSSEPRTVSLTDITLQAEWFINSVQQISQSLKRLHLVAIGLLVGILAVYVPFVVIQWEAITKNFISMVTALGSVGVPLLLLYFIYGILVSKQKKRYREAWDKLMEVSDKALAENNAAVELYDRMLAFSAPALRWVYEYKLDVAFYDDCCKMARSKLDHHKQKLSQRYEAIENICQDLDCRSGDPITVSVSICDEIDYNSPFCTGDKNSEFYSIIDNNMLEAITEGKRGNGR